MIEWTEIGRNRYLKYEKEKDDKDVLIKVCLMKESKDINSWDCEFEETKIKDLPFAFYRCNMESSHECQFMRRFICRDPMDIRKEK